MSEITDAELWSWVDRKAPELEQHLASHPADAARVAAIRASIASVAGSSAAPLPSHIGPHRIRQRLGQGGMGVVYEAEQAATGRRVALKVPHAFLSTDEAQRRWFTREVHALARLEHPGIARLYEAGSTREGQPYFVMELVTGGPLLEHARQLGVREKLELFALLCDAVAHAHGQAVIHRDLKPSNVLVDARGQPHVLDFGLARIVSGTPDAGGASDPDANVTLGSAQALRGTLAYMSPEQALGEGSVDTRSDIYSLGVILYELLTGTLPLLVDTWQLATSLRRIRHEEPRAASWLVPSLRGDLDTILQTALSKHPAERYASVLALAKDLRAHLAGTPIQARPPSLSARAARRLRGHWRKVIGALGAFAAVAVLGTLAIHLAVTNSHRELQLHTNLYRGIDPALFRISPFEEVRWQGSRAEVLVDGHWWELRGIERVRIGLIVEFCKQAGGSQWRRRFDEDILEVLERVLGREPPRQVRVELAQLTQGSPSETRVIAMTEANRKLVYAARHALPFERMLVTGRTIEVQMVATWFELLELDGLASEVLVPPLAKLAEAAQLQAVRFPDFEEAELFRVSVNDVLIELLDRSISEPIPVTVRDRDGRELRVSLRRDGSDAATKLEPLLQPLTTQPNK